MPDDSASLSPLDASRLVADLNRYEEGLTARTVGLTLMAWGVLTFGLFFVSYALAAGGSTVAPEIGILALAGVILAGVAFTNLLWKSRALSAQVGFRPWSIWGQGLALLVVGMVGMAWIDGALLPRTDSSVSLAMVATLLLAYLGFRMMTASWRRGPWVLLSAAALAIVDVLLVLLAPETLPEPNGWTHTMAALATALAIYVPGYLYFRQG